MKDAKKKRNLPDLRRRAVELSASGMGPCDICKEVRLARSTVWRALKRHEEEGEKALDQPMGRPSRLTDADRALIEELLLRGPEANGFDTPLWTLERIAEVIRRATGIWYTTAHLSRLMRSMGWSCQKPERRARERDEEAIGRWHEEGWPAIKKTQSTWVPQ